MKATILADTIAVTHTFRPDMEPAPNYLTISVPDGWEDVKKICKKVLEFRGLTYTFTGWNSDTNKCYFRQNADVAVVKSRKRAAKPKKPAIKDIFA